MLRTGRRENKLGNNLQWLPGKAKTSMTSRKIVTVFSSLISAQNGWCPGWIVPRTYSAQDERCSGWTTYKQFCSNSHALIPARPQYQHQKQYCYLLIYTIISIAADVACISSSKRRPLGGNKLYKDLSCSLVFLWVTTWCQLSEKFCS